MPESCVFESKTLCGYTTHSVQTHILTQAIESQSNLQANGKKCLSYLLSGFNCNEIYVMFAMATHSSAPLPEWWPKTKCVIQKVICMCCWLHANLCVISPILSIKTVRSPKTHAAREWDKTRDEKGIAPGEWDKNSTQMSRDKNKMCKDARILLFFSVSFHLSICCFFVSHFVSSKLPNEKWLMIILKFGQIKTWFFPLCAIFSSNPKLHWKTTKWNLLTLLLAVRQEFRWILRQQ